MPATVWLAESVRSGDLRMVNRQACCLHQCTWPRRVQFLLHLKGLLVEAIFTPERA
jgi:hypothetical protein